MKRSTLLAISCLATFLISASALAQGTSAKKAGHAPAAKPALAVFLIESPHTPDECLNVMDEVNKSKDLGAWDWGCAAGNHTGYRIVHAVDENAALAMVPEDVRAKAHAY